MSIAVLEQNMLFSAEKFLKAVIQSGDRGFEAFVRFIRENQDNRYVNIMDALGIPLGRTSTAGNAAAGNDGACGNANMGNNMTARKFTNLM